VAVAAPVTVNIDLASFKFAPGEVSIPAGSTVIWTNKDAAKHDVVADDNSFESPVLDKGQTYSRKFDTPGTITYYCKFHGSPGQGMIGKLVVTPVQAGAVPANTTAAAAPAATQVVAVATTAAATTAAPATQPATTAAAATAAPATTAATTTAASTQPPGIVNFRDDLQQSDQVTVAFDKMVPPPSGFVFFAWLVNSTDGSVLRLGQIIPGPNGAVNQKFSDPQQRNLLAIFDKFIITHEQLDPTPNAPSSMIIYSGQLPGPSLIHIRHLLVSFPAAPN
jgi:plastocyanin